MHLPWSKGSTFLAWIVRMSFIKRWALMHCMREENVSEHSHQTAVIAHMLALIKNKLYGGQIDPGQVAVLALYHEVSEAKLQDLNSKTKYLNPEFTKQYKLIEHKAEEECLATLPIELKEDFAPLIIQSNIAPELKTLVKAADTIAAYIKARDELRFHNPEFIHVKDGLETVLEQYAAAMPEVQYFLNNFVPLCWATVDQLSGIDAALNQTATSTEASTATTATASTTTATEASTTTAATASTTMAATASTTAATAGTATIPSATNPTSTLSTTPAPNLSEATAPHKGKS